MIDAMNGIYDFLIGGGLYDFIVQAYAYVIIRIMAFKFYMMKVSLEFSFAIAKEIIQQLNITAEINKVLNLLPSDVLQQLHFFNVIAGLNLLLNAAVTRFVVGFRG